jgi:HEXXH motif-containing protein
MIAHPTAQSPASAGRSTKVALSTLLDGFSLPRPEFVGGLDGLVPLIVREYAAGITGAFVGRGVDVLEAQSDGLIEYLAGWSAEPTGWPADRLGWDYAFGDAYRTMHNVGGDPAGVCAAIAMHLGARGCPGRWSANLPVPRRLRWDDLLLLAASTVSVESDGATARVDYRGDEVTGALSLTRVDGRWHADAPPGAEVLPRIDRHGVAFTVLTRDALAMRDYEDLLERARPTVDPRMVAVFEQAVDIIAAYAPQYLRWIARTVHQMFLIAPKPGRVESGSVEHYLGLVHLSEHPEPLPVAELLAHEATHQYMNVAAKLEPLDDGSDSTMYWSPAVQTERPVSKIVAAFHAFGNVLLFYRWCREAGVAERAECDRQEALLGSWMEFLAPPVRDNPALTRTGNALCRPLLAALEL